MKLLNEKLQAMVGGSLSCQLVHEGDFFMPLTTIGGKGVWENIGVGGCEEIIMGAHEFDLVCYAVLQ
jgi:hypothetical protein